MGQFPITIICSTSTGFTIFERKIWERKFKKKNLLFRDSLADRTFQDLTQYPIFPWIISDYKSKELDLDDEKYYRDLTKPMGALNPERLSRLKERYDEMGDPKYVSVIFFSGKIYFLFFNFAFYQISVWLTLLGPWSGSILFSSVSGQHMCMSSASELNDFLKFFRKHPKLMLCLQNGRFDHPDRMFNKLSDVYNNCLNNMSDFKVSSSSFFFYFFGSVHLLHPCSSPF